MQHCGIPAELVDQEGGDQLPIIIIKQCHSAVQRGKDAATIDVADHNHRQLLGPCQPEVDIVAGPQVDLRWRAGTLADDHLEATRELVVRREGGGCQVAATVRVLP